jgi:hypothetical protein
VRIAPSTHTNTSATSPPSTAHTPRDHAHPPDTRHRTPRDPYSQRRRSRTTPDDRPATNPEHPAATKTPAHNHSQRNSDPCRDCVKRGRQKPLCATASGCKRQRTALSGDLCSSWSREASGPRSIHHSRPSLPELLLSWHWGRLAWRHAPSLLIAQPSSLARRAIAAPFRAKRYYERAGQWLG